MIESKIFSLVAIGFAAIFGLQGAFSLSAKYFLEGTKTHNSSCSKIIFSKQAFFVKIPIAYFAIFFYIVVLLQLMQIFFQDKIELFWITYEIYLVLPITFYYAYIMFFKLRVICFGCIRIYLSNILMATALTSHYF